MNEYGNLLQEIIEYEEELLLNFADRLERLLSMYKELELSMERDGLGGNQEEFLHFKLDLETLTEAYKMMERGKQKSGRGGADDFSEINEWTEGMRIFCMTYQQRMRGNQKLLEALNSYPFVHSVSADECEDFTMHTIYGAPEGGAGFESSVELDARTRREEPPMACVYAPPGLMGRRQKRERKGFFARIFKREP